MVYTFKVTGISKMLQSTREKASSSARPSTPERWQELARKTTKSGRPTREIRSPLIDQRLLPPTKVVPLIKEPTLQNYITVRNCLHHGDHIWMEDFLAKDGLILLLTGLEEMSAEMKKLDDVLVVLENIKCLREVLNSEPGIEFIVRFKCDETAIQLSKVLSTDNVAVKHQVYELLGALSAYSREGFRLVHKCLKKSQKVSKRENILDVVILDLKHYADDDTKDPYKATLLAFLNCLIYFSDDENRNCILLNLKRSYFFETLVHISAEPDASIQTQISALLTTLDEIRHPEYLSLSAHTTLQRLFSTTPDRERGRFVKIFQTLMERQTNSDMDSSKDTLNMIENLLDLPDNNGSRPTDAATSPMILDPRPTRNIATSPIDMPLRPLRTVATSPIIESQPVAPPFIPAFSSSTALPPPPPFQPKTASSKISPAADGQLSGGAVQSIPTASGPPPPAPPPPPPPGMPKPPPPPGGLIPPPPPPGTGHIRSNTWSAADAGQKLSKDNLKPVRWNKVFAPLEKLSHSIWRQTSKDEEVKIDTTKLKSLFADNTMRRGSVGPVMSKTPSLSHDLIDPKRSLKVNICLKKFKDVTVKELVEKIETLDISSFELDDLTGLMGILPTPEEIEVFKDFSGKLEELDNAELFFYWIVRVPDFRLRVELLHFSKECPAQADVLIKDFKEILDACNLVLKNKSWQDFLHYSLHVGNVLNSGRTIGDAQAVKLDGLLKLAETASNQPKISLLHFIVQESQKQNMSSLEFVDSFASISKVTGLQFDILQTECNTLLARNDELEKRLDEASSDLKARVKACLKDPETVVRHLQACRDEVSVSIKKVAEYFVEDAVQFKIDECFKNIHTFVKQVATAKRDLEKMEEESRNPSEPTARRFSVRQPGVSTLPRNFGINKNAEVFRDHNDIADDLESRVLDQLTKVISSGVPLRKVRRRS